jgi:sigma-B regulation protein RsbU (phosphoserine phosphatase)
VSDQRATTTGRTAVIMRAFQGLDQESLDLFRNLAVDKQYPPDTVLCQEGAIEDIFYIITSGRVVVTRTLEDGEEFVMAMLGPNTYFGEMALITKEPRSATVRTIVDTEVLEISKELFDQVFETSPALARNLIFTMIRSIREIDQRAIDDLESRNVELAQAYDDLREAQEELVAKERMERELEIAGEVQRSLLPVALPSVPGYEFAARFEPARQVGGDFFDAHFLDDGRVALLLADVSDKGAHAALFMAVTRTLFLTESRRIAEPVEVVRSVHNNLMESAASEMFVTVLYGVLEPETGLFRYVRCGHDYPLWVHGNGETQFLRGRGRFLGMWPDPPIEEQQITLEPGDVLVIYSDGITDMANVEGESFGKDRLASVVKNARIYDAERIAQQIYNVVAQHRGPAEAFDDFTLLTVRVLS